MIKKIVISIDDVDYEVPVDITVSHYAEIMRRSTISETELEKAMDIISVLMEIPYQIIRELDPERMVELSFYLQDRVNMCNVDYQKTFKFKGVEYGGLNLTKMTFGEYIDLASMVKSDISIYMNIHKLCSILYRPIVTKDKNNYTIKPYNIDEHELQSEIFKELPVKYFFGAFINLFNYLNQTKKDYEILFGDRIDTTEEKDKEKKKEEEDNNLPWYKMVMALSNEDFSKIGFVTSRPVVECFNHLTYLTIKNEELRQQQLEHQNKMNLI